MHICTYIYIFLLYLQFMINYRIIRLLLYNICLSIVKVGQEEVYYK